MTILDMINTLRSKCLTEFERSMIINAMKKAISKEEISQEELELINAAYDFMITDLGETLQ